MNDKNNAYTIVSLVFFLPYALFQPPATVLIREIGPRRFLAVIVILWGAVVIVRYWIAIGIAERSNVLFRVLASSRAGRLWPSSVSFLVASKLGSTLACLSSQHVVPSF
jgi:hypothetical protein